MSGKLIVVMSTLPREHREAVASAAAAHGFDALRRGQPVRVAGCFRLRVGRADQFLRRLRRDHRRAYSDGLLTMLRRQQEYTGIVSRREWTRNLAVRSVKNSRVTMLGTGDIGQEAAIRLRAFGPARITGVNRGGGNPLGLFDSVLRQEQIEAALPDTDLLIVSLPGTAATRHMLDEKRLALLPEGALIVNVGRGSVLDQKALEK